MRYLVTGHTGFKGAWLCLLLDSMGHEVCGLALDPEPGSLYETARVAELVASDHRQDIREKDAVRRVIREVAPDVVVHMAAQPLVRESYADPRWTMETNVMGTFNVLEAVSLTPSVRAHLVITTDKVYRNVNRIAGYTEEDPLGGHDPYSASKAMADLLTQSWVASFDGPPTAIARAGNVIGGGDVSKDRLFPDLLSGFAAGRTVEIRYPSAVRPWQHVLDCLHGYVLLTDALLSGSGDGEWNFGPGPDSFVTVGVVADMAAALWGSGAAWAPTPGDHPHEAELLALDAAKARDNLGWRDLLTFEMAVEWTVEWARAMVGGAEARDLCERQLAAYRRLASS